MNNLFAINLNGRHNKPLLSIILIGLLIRGSFLIFFAKFYFNRENILVDGDTFTWVESIANLIETGTYKIDANSEYAYFTRMPGYSFFIGIFYLLTNGNLAIAFPLIAWTQVLLDCAGIYLMYQIGISCFRDKNPSTALAFLYAAYPFVVVWNPVVYSESISIFFMLLGVHYFLKEVQSYKYVLAGLFVSIGILNRPQIIFLVPVMGLIIVYKYRYRIKTALKYLFQFGIVVILVYGAWPARNYINHGKLILMQDLRALPNCAPDRMAFWKYIFSVKAEAEPQFSNIIHNKKVDFPRSAYIVPGDSAKLSKAVILSQTCGSGFSNWNGYWKEPIVDANCDLEIAQLFDELRANQIKYNKLNFYVLVPLQNFKKAIFKNEFYNQDSMIKKLASFLFLYRTFLIIVGWIGLWLMFRHKDNNIYPATLILLYFMIWYLTLCAGTALQLRNIEMRYLLPADVLMLIPAAYLFNIARNRIDIKYLKLIFKKLK